MTRTINVLLLLIFMGTASIHSLVWAQASATAANINGTITDEQGAAIAGATVSAKNVGTSLVRQISTGEDGTYLVQQLPPGIYEVTVSADGFASRTAKLEVELGTTVKLDLAVTVAQDAGIIIEVTANSTLEKGKTESRTNIDTGRIDNLPINRRNFLDFALTTPRVNTDGLPSQGIVPTSGLTFNGQSARFNNFTIDGVDNNDFISGAVRQTFSQEAVQEFQVVSNNYSAEFGRALGGIVNIITKGGTNTTSGRIFFLNRNDTIAARNAFAPFDPEFKQYQFGATLGGPIKKDKIFYFTAFERLSIAQNNFVTFSNDVVAAGRRQGFTIDNGPRPFGVGVTTFLAKSDIEVSPSNRLSIRYNYGGTYDGAIEPFGGLVADTRGGTQRLDENAISVTNTYINVNRNLVNETRFLYSKFETALLANGDDTQIQLVAPEGNVFFGRTTFLPQPDRELRIFQAINNTSLTLGRSQLKFGVDLRQTRVTATLTVNARGLGIFVPLDFASISGIPGAPFLTGLQAFDPSLRTPEQRGFLTAFAAVLPQVIPNFPANVPLADLGIPIAFVQGFGSDKPVVSSTDFSTYVQNDINLKPNLVLKAGLRYDVARQDEFPNNNGNFSPRVGIAYGITPNLRFSVSGGIFVSTPFTGVSFPIKLLRRQQVTVTVTPFPFTVFPFSLPNRRYPVSLDSPIPPPGVPVIRQLGLTLVYDPKVKNSYTGQGNLSFEYLLGKGTVVSVSYDFLRGVKLLSPRNINPVVRPIADPVTNAITGRVDPSQGDIFEYESARDSYYHAVTFSIQRRLSKKLDFLAFYTFSKSIDTYIDNVNFAVVGANNTLDIRGERSLSPQDIRGRFVASALWNISYSKNPLLRDYQLSTIVRLNSGQPYNLLAGVDLNRDGDNPSFDRPLGISRNAGIKPGFANVDLRLSRTISFNEKLKFEALIEVFNFFNRVNISDIDNTFPPDAQGRFNLPSQDNGRFIVPRDRFRGAFAPRQFQFGFKVHF